MVDGPLGTEAGLHSSGLGGKPAPRPGNTGDKGGLKPAGMRRQRAFRHALTRIAMQVGLALQLQAHACSGLSEQLPSCAQLRRKPEALWWRRCTASTSTLGGNRATGMLLSLARESQQRHLASMQQPRRPLRVQPLQLQLQSQQTAHRARARLQQRLRRCLSSQQPSAR